MESLTSIPNYLVAGDLKTLRRLMLLNNAKLNAHVQYFDIQNVGGKWYAFYYDFGKTILDEVQLSELKAVK